MADTKVSALTELDAVPAVGDWIPFVDVSDTTHAASGTTKKINADRFIYTNGTANTLAANLNVNSKNLTNVGTVSTPTITTPTIAGTMTISGFVGEALVAATSGVHSFKIIGGDGASTGIGWRSYLIGANVQLGSDNIPEVVGSSGYTVGYAIGFAVENSSDAGMTFWSGSGSATNMTRRMVMSNAGNFTVSSSGGGTITCIDLVETSSQDIKENLEEIPTVLDRLADVKAYRYNRKGDPVSHKRIGLLAEQVGTVFPEVVADVTVYEGEEEVSTKGINYGRMSTLAMLGLNELVGRLQTARELLSSRIDQGANKLADHEQRIRTLETAVAALRNRP